MKTAKNKKNKIKKGSSAKRKSKAQQPANTEELMLTNVLAYLVELRNEIMEIAEKKNISYEEALFKVVKAGIAAEK